ncbi:MAG TPA: delta-60 repeat domain-containing protein, partial [Niastella sp.]|nr:delta-60 repeat domain-containing protein [Niastella sp.]
MKQLTSMFTMLFLSIYVTAQVGSLDVSFNSPTGFIINQQSPGGDDYGSSIAVQNDGKILVTVVVPEQYFKILRYNLTGTLDGNFGTAGVVTVRESAL